MPLLLRQLVAEFPDATVELTRGGVHKTVVCRGGLLMRYMHNQQHERLGQHLLGLGMVAASTLLEVVQVPRGEVLLGDALVASGWMVPAHVQQALQHQLTEGILEAAQWTDGQWTLTPGNVPTHPAELLHGVEAGPLARLALERVDVWQRILERTPGVMGPLSPLGMGDGLPGPFEVRLWELARAGMDAAGMAGALHVPLFPVVVTLFQMLEQGHLKPRVGKVAQFAPPPVTFGGVLAPAAPVLDELVPPPVTMGGPVPHGPPAHPRATNPRVQLELEQLQQHLHNDATRQAHALAREILKEDPTNPEALAAKEFAEHLATQEVTLDRNVDSMLSALRAQGMLPPARTDVLPPTPQPAAVPPPLPPGAFGVPRSVAGLRPTEEDAAAFGDTHAQVFDALSPRLIPSLLCTPTQLRGASLAVMDRGILTAVDGRKSVAELVALLRLDVVTVSRALLAGAQLGLVRWR